MHRRSGQGTPPIYWIRMLGPRPGNRCFKPMNKPASMARDIIASPLPPMDPETYLYTMPAAIKRSTGIRYMTRTVIPEPKF